MDEQENATPAPEGELLDEAPQLQDDGAPPEEIAEAPQLTDEDYEINFLGTDKFKLERETPEHVRVALQNLAKSLNKGWTEKNMRLAEKAKADQAAVEQEKAGVELSRASIKELARRESLQEQINQYDNVDWARWADQDPQAAWKAQMGRDAVSRQLAKLDGEIQQKQTEQQARQKEQADAWLAQSAERLQTSIPGWNSEKANSLAKFASESFLNTNTPMDRGALQAMAWHPGLMQMAEEARLYRESVKRAAEVPKQPPAVPVPKVGGVAAVAKDPNKMSDSEWAAWREQDLANKRRAQNLRPRK